MKAAVGRFFFNADLIQLVHSYLKKILRKNQPNTSFLINDANYKSKLCKMHGFLIIYTKIIVYFNGFNLPMIDISQRQHHNDTCN